MHLKTRYEIVILHFDPDDRNSGTEYVAVKTPSMFMILVDTVSRLLESMS